MADGEVNKPFRVMMWCVPRSISTAITKCFSFIDNTQIWFEPYWVRYFQELLARDRGWYPDTAKGEHLDVDTYLATNYNMFKGTALEGYFDTGRIDKCLVSCEDIAQQLNNLPPDKSVFIKDMSYGTTNYYHHLPRKEACFKYTFLIRDPERVHPSLRNLFFRQNPILLDLDLDLPTFDFLDQNPFMDEGYYYKSQYDLWKYVKEHIDPNPIVIDSDELLTNPTVILPKYFKACGMPWDDALLNWDQSPDVVSSWKVLFPLISQAKRITGEPGKDVMDNAHSATLASTKFLPSKPKLPRSEMTPDVLKAIEATSEYYKEMAATMIVAT